MRFTLKHLAFYLSLIALGLSACTTPTAPAPTLQPPPTNVPTPEPNATPLLINGPQLEYAGIGLTIPAGLASGASARVEPEAPATQDGPYWLVYPAHPELTFVNYPVTTNRYWLPRVTVFPVEAFEQMNPGAKGELDLLRALLETRPAAPDRLPLLPLVNSAQVIRSQVTYLDFKSGSGVRYVTQYDQSYAPINNLELFYAFQGLTADGRYVVSLVAPLTAPFLADGDDPAGYLPPEGVPMPDLNTVPNVGEAVTEYFNQVTEKLNAQPANGFTPGLDALDRLSASVEVK